MAVVPCADLEEDNVGWWRERAAEINKYQKFAYGRSLLSCCEGMLGRVVNN